MLEEAFPSLLEFFSRKLPNIGSQRSSGTLRKFLSRTVTRGEKVTSGLQTTSVPFQSGYRDSFAWAAVNKVPQMGWLYTEIYPHGCGGCKFKVKGVGRFGFSLRPPLLGLEMDPLSMSSHGPSSVRSLSS